MEKMRKIDLQWSPAVAVCALLAAFPLGQYSATGQFTQFALTSELACLCLGQTVSFQCTTFGIGSTRYLVTGCDYEALNLLHTGFEGGTSSRECLSTIGVSVSAQGVSDHGGNDSYTSSLNINVTMTPNMSMTVECYHDDGENPDLIGMPSTIMTAVLQAVSDIQLSVSGSTVRIDWSEPDGCLAEKFIDVNCWMCPSRTFDSYVECTNYQPNTQRNCSVSIIRSLCGTNVSASKVFTTSDPSVPTTAAPSRGRLSPGELAAIVVPIIVLCLVTVIIVMIVILVVMVLKLNKKSNSGNGGQQDAMQLMEQAPAVDVDGEQGAVPPAVDVDEGQGAVPPAADVNGEQGAVPPAAAVDGEQGAVPPAADVDGEQGAVPPAADVDGEQGAVPPAADVKGEQGAVPPAVKVEGAGPDIRGVAVQTTSCLTDTEVRTFVQDLHRGQQKLIEMFSQFLTMKQKYSENENKIKQLEKEKEELLRKNQEMSVELKSKEEEVIRLKEENERLDKQVKDLFAKVVGLEETVQQECEQRKILQGEVDDSKIKISELEGKFNNLLQMFVQDANQVGTSFNIEEELRKQMNNTNCEQSTATTESTSSKFGSVAEKEIFMKPNGHERGMSSEWSADQLEDVAANNAERIPSGSGESPVPSPELVSPGEDVPEPQSPKDIDKYLPLAEHISHDSTLKEVGSNKNGAGDGNPQSNHDSDS